MSEFPIAFPDGTVRALSDWAGAPVLLVNVASKCGFTPQYEGLEKLHRDGLAIIGFPCNQFGDQEPGSSAEIAEFCSLTYNVTFPMFEKVAVNGPETDPLYKWLKRDTPGSNDADVEWNFAKFLIDRDGKPVKRFGDKFMPADIASDIEKLL
jgi:glutathione peroxidase